MIKRILLASLFLFMPMFAHGDIVIGSMGSFEERNLPFDSEVMNESYAKVLRGYCVKNKQSIFEDFFDGKMVIPFSVKDLLKLCRKITVVDTQYYQCDIFKSNEFKSKACSHFVLGYIEEISRKYGY